MTETRKVPDPASLRALEIPREGEEPVFAEPWQARIFGIVVHLCEARGVPWKDWAERFGQELAEAGEAGSGRDPGAYYERWLDTAEAWLSERGVVSTEELEEVKRAIHEAQLAAHDHD